MQLKVERSFVLGVLATIGLLVGGYVLGGWIADWASRPSPPPIDKCGGNGRFTVLLPAGDKATLLSVGVLDTCVGDYYVMGFQPTGPLALRIKMSDMKDYLGNPNAPQDQQTQQPATEKPAVPMPAASSQAQPPTLGRGKP